MSGDDTDAERHELLRLLSTAQDDERKSIIRNSLMMLDSPDHRSNKGGGKRPLKTPINAHLFDGERIGLEASYTKSPPIRPMSARLRRPSMNNLDVIQEEFRGSFRKKEIKLSDSAEKREITTIVIEDILELNASSFDPRFSPWNLFSFNGNSGSLSSSFWVSTGLMPQYIAFELKMSWDVREVRVICSNVEHVSFTVEGAVNRIPMHKINSTCFSYDLKTLPETSQLLRAYGDKIVFHFEEASDAFIIVKNIQIRAIPSES